MDNETIYLKRFSDGTVQSIVKQTERVFFNARLPLVGA